MKLAVVFPVLNQFPLATLAIRQAVECADGPLELLVIDNGSDKSFLHGFMGEKLSRARIERHEKSIGVYPTFWDALKYTDAEVLAFFHSDLIIIEKGWDDRVMRLFRNDETPTHRLGLLGFIGSNEIDSAGGRGLGTTSNFQGGAYEWHKDFSEGMVVDDIISRGWKGSPAHVHGKVSDGYSPAAVVDGCAMIFRREALEQIPQRENFPPHHFYDRLLSCEVRERGWDMGVLGIACDHISGQTVNQEPKYAAMAEEWCRAHLPVSAFVGNPPAWAWDATVYQEAERQWLREYRDEKRLVPCKV